MVQQHIATALKATGPVWFPGLASELRRQFWIEEKRFSVDRYTTAAWLSGGADAGRRLSEIKVPPGRIILEGADAVVTALVGTNGLVLASDDFARDAASSLQNGIELLMRMPSLSTAVERLVRSVHILSPAAAGYDVSHSDPALPFSIFLTVPVDESHCSWRTAESLVHEAMHLQLSLIERWCPFVALGTNASGYSPWQQRQRPIQGLLHGLYVFRAIDQMLAAAQTFFDVGRGEAAYVARRREEIADEISTVERFAECTDLTDAGCRLVRRLLFDGEAPLSDQGSLASWR